MAVADVDFVFDGYGVVSGFGEDIASDVLVLVGRILVGIADPKKVAVGELMEDASFRKRVMDGSGNVFVDGTELICRVNDGLHGIKIAIQGQKESSFPVAAERTAERAFVILAGSKGVFAGARLYGEKQSTSITTKQSDYCKGRGAAWKTVRARANL